MHLCYIINKCTVSCFEAAYASYFAVYFFLCIKSWCISVWSLHVFYVSVWVLSRVSGFLSQTKNMHERRVGSSKWTVGLFMCYVRVFVFLCSSCSGCHQHSSGRPLQTSAECESERSVREKVVGSNHSSVAPLSFQRKILFMHHI